MFEAVTEAIVLDKVDQGEQDSRVFLFTKDFGKISAKITSSRKITSKLAAHFEPINIVMTRIIDKNGPIIADGLTIKNGIKDINVVRVLGLVKELAAEGQKDLTLWNFLVRLMESGFEEKNIAEVLSLLGFDPSFAKCHRCYKNKPAIFSVRDLAFYCKNCISSKDNYAF